MTDDELLANLTDLGIERSSYRALALLPLIQVAWADGRIQAAERRLIVEAMDRYQLGADARNLVDSWMKDRPGETFFLKSRHTLLALARRERGLGRDITPETLTELVGLCQDVAKAAGGLFDRLWTVSEDEQHAIWDIAGALCLGPDVSKDHLASLFGE